MSVPLSLPLAPGLFSDARKSSFVFTRQVPCMADSTDKACIEIITASDSLNRKGTGDCCRSVSNKLGLGRKEALQSSSATYMRLVTEPTSLQFAESDMRRYAYWTTTGTKLDHPVMEYERTHAIVGPIARTE